MRATWEWGCYWGKLLIVVTFKDSYCVHRIPVQFCAYLPVKIDLRYGYILLSKCCYENWCNNMHTLLARDRALHILYGQWMTLMCELVPSCFMFVTAGLGVGLSVTAWMPVMWSVLYCGWCGVCCAVFQVPLQSSFLFEVRALQPFSSGFTIMGQNIAAYVPPARPTKILRCIDSWCVAGWNCRVWAWIWSESQESYWGGCSLHE